jgi:hypothetical protein
MLLTNTSMHVFQFQLNSLTSSVNGGGMGYMRPHSGTPAAMLPCAPQVVRMAGAVLVEQGGILPGTMLTDGGKDAKFGLIGTRYIKTNSENNPCPVGLYHVPSARLRKRAEHEGGTTT